MRYPLMLLAATAALSAAAGAAGAATVEIKDAVARVTVIPENRPDIKVEFLSNNPRLPLQVREFGGKTIVDGDLGHRIRSCNGSGERVRVGVRGIGDVVWRDMPQVVIRTPRDARVEAGGAVDVDVVEAQTLQAVGAGGLDRGGPGVETDPGLVGPALGAELHAEQDVVAAAAFERPVLERFADQHLVVAHAVEVAGVDQIDSGVERGVDRSQALLPVRRPVHARHAHRAEADGGDFGTGLAEFAHLHREPPASPIAGTACKLGLRIPKD